MSGTLASHTEPDESISVTALFDSYGGPTDGAAIRAAREHFTGEYPYCLTDSEITGDVSVDDLSALPNWSLLCLTTDDDGTRWSGAFAAGETNVLVRRPIPGDSVRTRAGRGQGLCGSTFARCATSRACRHDH
jgi:hypothetical protein